MRSHGSCCKPNTPVVPTPVAPVTHTAPLTLESDFNILSVLCDHSPKDTAAGPYALRGCIEEHWMDKDFVVLKVDMRNAFNMVSRQVFLDECATLSLGVMVLWDPPYAMAPSWPDQLQVSSKSGVQQGDPLGPLLFALVLQKLVSSLDADDECAEILLQGWYLDNGALAGTRSAVLCALHLIEDLAWACTRGGMSSR